MSSTLLQYRSEPLFVMSQSQLNHVMSQSNQQDLRSSNLTESKQSPFSSSQNELQTSNDPRSSSAASIATSNTLQTHQSHPEIISLKSTNRRDHHEVSADNFRIRYYMNLNLVKQPQHIATQSRASSLPHQASMASTPPTKMPSQQMPITPSSQTAPRQPAQNASPPDFTFNAFYEHDQARKSIECKQPDLDLNDGSESDELCFPAMIHNNANHHKTIKVYPGHGHHGKTQNNTPPRSIMMKKHKRSRLSRIRSRSDGSLSFHGGKKRSVDSTEDDDDNDSVSTADSVNNHHLNSINLASQITPPRSGIHSSSSSASSKPFDAKYSHFRPSPNSPLLYQSSRTPPGNNFISRHHNAAPTTTHHHEEEEEEEEAAPSSKHRFVQQRKNCSEPVGFLGIGQQSKAKSASISIQRSRPVSINKQKVKPRFDVDFKPMKGNDFSYQSPPDSIFGGLTNPDSLVDDEANFDMD
mmetsp:Transcript_53221/g.84969  ORF Transcript_53221/g.84969 Transcript_53221/m.84969 type:complete len:468 (-) Transcript_53221:513-1916(-)